MAAGPDCTGRAVLDGSGSSDPDGDTLHYTWESGFKTVEGVRPTLTLPPGDHTIRLSVHDGTGQVSTDSVIVTVEDRTPPTITVPDHITAEQTSLAGTPVSLPDRERGTARTTVTVVDSVPPVIKKLVARPSSLWPPNHKMVPVEVTPTVVDVCDARPRCRIASVGSSDPVTCKGDNTSPDCRVTGDLSVDLRAERAGSGSGRLYTVTVRCTDASGNAAAGNVAVSVPHIRVEEGRGGRKVAPTSDHRLRLRADTIGTRHEAVKFLGVRTREAFARGQARVPAPAALQPQQLLRDAAPGGRDPVEHDDRGGGACA